MEKGDIGALVAEAKSGSAAQVGKPAIWDDQIPNCCFHRQYSLSGINFILLNDYADYLLRGLYRFFYALSGKFAQQHLAGGVGPCRTTMKCILHSIAQIVLPLCSLRHEQQEMYPLD